MPFGIADRQGISDGDAYICDHDLFDPIKDRDQLDLDDPIKDPVLAARKAQVMVPANSRVQLNC